jgi:hypothetical protein
MHYSIARNGQTLGSFPEQELRHGVGTGLFHYHDLAWTEGMPEWAALGQVLGLSPSQAGPVFIPPPFQQPKKMGDDAGMRMLLPVGRSGWAIAAGYLGLFALLIVPAPAALIVSLIAISDIRKSTEPGRDPKHGMGRAIFGLIAGIVGTLILLLLILSSLSQS